MKKYKLILIITIIVIIIAALLFVNLNTYSPRPPNDLQSKIISEHFRLNNCEVVSDCVIGCSNVLHVCGELYLYNKNDDLSYLNRLSKRYLLSGKNSEIACDMDWCFEFEHGVFNNIKVNCVNNMCVPDNNAVFSNFMSYEITYLE